MRYLTVFFILVNTTIGLSQMRFSHIKVENGLSQSSVNTVVKDKHGFYWIGTQYGLNKFDGKSIECFYTTNTPQLADNFIISAINDDEDNVWFATRNNLCRYNADTKSFKTIITDTMSNVTKGHNAIYYLFKDDFGNIIFSTANRFIKITKAQLSKQNPQLQYAINEKIKFSAAFIQESCFYGLIYDTLYKYKLSATNAKLLSKITYNQFLQKVNRTVFCTEGENIILSNNKLYKIKNDSLVQLFKNYFNDVAINTIIKHKLNYLVGTDNGLYEFDSNQFLVNAYKNYDANQYSLSENKVLSLSKTNDGLLWIGNSNTGVNIFDQNTSVFKIIKPNDDKTFIPFCCTLKNNTQLIVGTDNGVDEFVLQNKTWKCVNTKFQNHKVTSLCFVENTLYLGTTKGLFECKNGQYKEVDLEKTSPIIFDVKLDYKKQLVVSSILGVYILNTQNNTIIKHIKKDTPTTKTSKLKSNYVFNTTFDLSNNYFINHTVGSVLLDSQLNYKKNIFDNFKYKNLSEIMITDAVSTLDNTVWFASLGNGIYCYENNMFKQFNIANGLSNNVVAAIKKDNYNTIWASTNYGINYIDKNRKTHQYIKELAIPSPEFITNGAFQNKNDLFFCSNSGLLHFNVDSVLKSSLTEKLAIVTNAVFKNHTTPISIIDSTIILNYLDKVLSVNFCVPSYRYYDKIKFKYQLQGFDTTWQASENNKAITFTNLDYGTYKLLINAQLAQFNWQQQLSINIIVRPPFWKTTWFIIMISLIVLALVILIVRYISRIELKKQLVQMQINQKIYEEKERVSKDLHDNIGSQISTLIYGIDKIHLTQKTESAERLSDFARNTLNELREIVWTLHQEDINFEVLKQKLEGFVFELRSNYNNINIQFEFTFSKNYVLITNQALAFYRIIQEAVNNSIKHSECKTVSVLINQTNLILVATIADDGKGFDTSTRKKGHYGLDNMQARAEKDNINYEISSQINNGTKTTLTLHLK